MKKEEGGGGGGGGGDGGGSEYIYILIKCFDVTLKKKKIVQLCDLFVFF